ncbi:N-glycosylase/DNA lyase-like, partial [Stegodyphus dumicola]|uniref:N-glycosylase/DNA lyase-like n=1 Tax=Stegodyphus dumicola TaxID=202533 RepID=UPI0015B128B5
WKVKNNSEWQGVFSELVWTLKQDSKGNILYFVHHISENESNSPSVKKMKTSNYKKGSQGKDMTMSSEKLDEMLRDYLNLHVKLEDLYKVWNKCDENFKEVSRKFKGIRILRQDPVENLISFICSANNNIPRITSMVEKLCRNYGKELCKIDGQLYYSFPTLESLSGKGVEEKLRNLGFGYRAKYINQAAKVLHENHPPGWLETLRTVPYKDAHKALTKLPGVGAKVADCVCLMSLDKYNAIPVDTHIWQVTVRDYLPHLKGAKTLSQKAYQEIGSFYRERFGNYAGWANTILFAADLKKFKDGIKATE